MKYLLAGLLLCCAATFSAGQGKTSLGLEVGFPTGSGSDGVGTGFGGSLRHEKEINKNVTWTASLGYVYFPANASMYGATVTGHFGFLPLLVGLKYYPVESFNGFYFGTDLGLTAMSFKGSVSYGGYTQSASASENKFTVTPQMGYHFEKVDFAFRYNLIDQANYFGIRLGFILN